MKKLAIVYASNDGQTKKIGECMQKHLQKKAQDLQVDLFSVEEALNLNLQVYDRVLLGAGIKYGYFKKTVYRLIKANQEYLAKSESGFFGVCLTARKPEKRVPENNAYIRKFLQKSVWQPKTITAIAGALNYTHYNFFDTFMIKLIMTMTKGSTDTSKDIEYTDWQQVKSFAENFVKDLVSSKNEKAAIGKRRAS